MWTYFVWTIDPIPYTFATDLVPDFKPGLKGNPVKTGSYPRSCKGGSIRPPLLGETMELKTTNHCSATNGMGR